MKNNVLLETAKWRDVIELGLCMEIYDVCNDNQFDFCTPLDFANFLNLREPPETIAMKPKQKLRICYMIQAIAEKIKPKKEADKWFPLFLQRCGIDLTYYKNHKTDINSKETSEDNKEYKESIDNAIETWQKKQIHPV